jgi:hypothetical protein
VSGLKPFEPSSNIIFVNGVPKRYQALWSKSRRSSSAEGDGAAGTTDGNPLMNANQLQQPVGYLINFVSRGDWEWKRFKLSEYHTSAGE